MPTSTVVLPDGRLLITEKGGKLRVVKNNQLLATPALQLGVKTDGERGLLAVEADLKFDTNHYVYVHFTSNKTNYAQVSRFTMNGDTVVAGSELVILKIDPQLNGANHIGGAMHFGSDGKLYIGVGDNAVGADAQNTSSMHGKILRINGNGAIPTDNPFYNTNAGAKRAIWAIGLRNPFTFNVDPVSPNLMFINDVGENSYEEINVGEKAANYGWPQTEGPTDAPGITAPFYAYAPPGDGTRTSIAGGVSYVPTFKGFPADYHQDYFFGDYVQGSISTLDLGGQVLPFAQGFNGIIDIDQTKDGQLLVTTYDGVVHAIKYGSGTTPTGTASINGYVVNDTNKDGKWTSGEKGITGRTVWLDLNNDGNQGVTEPTLVTGDNGKFTFTNLAAGTYRVREVVPAGWKQTSPINNGPLFIQLTDGQLRSGVSFQVTTV
ncbi:MAG: PQQ-dependent sugar dehydrogenase [Tepidisphaeraceae bacterium]